MKLYLPTLFIFLFLISGCGSSPYTRQSADDIEARLRSEIRHWKETPHRLGGTDRDGIDCSGLVMVIYENLFSIRLPRSTKGQIVIGKAVRQNRLMAGDLVFFIPGENKRHVGIYLSNGEFAHTSSTRNVMISCMDDTYWSKIYKTSRRVLPENIQNN
ncbi:NlpC/P60 family protein [Desulfococcaceae bacterium HSG8]|nr:NlpC/P60 family protein [Desulfococcaceae bacterium HSG8]